MPLLDILFVSIITGGRQKVIISEIRKSSIAPGMVDDGRRFYV